MVLVTVPGKTGWQVLLYTDFWREVKEDIKFPGRMFPYILKCCMIKANIFIRESKTVTKETISEQ